MTGDPVGVEGVTISQEGDRVSIEIAGGRWEGSAAEAERLLTGLHYAIGRARPGTNIGSVFVNGSLWGTKFIEHDEHEAIRRMRTVVDGLGEFLDAEEGRVSSPTRR